MSTRITTATARPNAGLTWAKQQRDPMEPQLRRQFVAPRRARDVSPFRLRRDLQRG